MTRVVLGLGSNVGNREHHLFQAVSRLDCIVQQLHTSSIYESSALLPENAPDTWNIPFLNMAVSGHTELGIHPLLGAIKTIELQLGRQQADHWAPREIDIDILLYGEVILEDEYLHVPHLGLLKRAFALTPVSEIAADFIYPGPGIYAGQTIQAIASQLRLDHDPGCTIYSSASIS